MASKYDCIDGKLVKYVEEDVEDTEAAEAELQADLDAAQNALNDTVAAETTAGEQYQTAETAAEVASSLLDAARATREAAEATLAQKLETQQTFTAAVAAKAATPIKVPVENANEPIDETADDAAEEPAAEPVAG